MKPGPSKKEHMKEAVILAGGLGTRLRNITHGIPKSMAPVNGRPFLEYVLAYLDREKIERVVVAAGYRHEQVKAGTGNRFRNIEVVYSVEDEPLGTGGAIRKALTHIESDSCLVLNGDTLFNVDTDAFRQHYNKCRPVISLALKPMENFDRTGTLSSKETG